MKSKRHKSRGAYAVEAAISSLFALTMFVFGIDIARLGYQAVTLQYVLSRALRWGSLGQTINDPNTGTPLTREASIQYRINEVASSVGLNLSGATTSICPFTQPNCTVNNAGGPNETIIVRTTQPTPLFWKAGNINLSASVVTRNEPYA